MPQNNTVTFNSILVNAVNANSGIFVGTNSQSSWNTNNNNKFGFGVVLGARNVISRAVNIFMDNDLIDTPIITGNYDGVKIKGQYNNLRMPPYQKEASLADCISTDICCPS